MRGNIRPFTIDDYIERINDLEFVEFDKLVPWTTAGDWRPPYAYQWIASTKIRDGDDDPYEGAGGTPHEAVRDLWKGLKKIQNDTDKGRER